MRFLLPVLALLAVSVPSPAPAQTYVADEYVDTLTSTGTSVNTSSDADLGGTTGLWIGPYTVQCTAAVYIRQVTASDSTVTSTNGLLLEGGKSWPIRSISGRRFVAIISVAGTAACKFYRVHQ